MSGSQKFRSKPGVCSRRVFTRETSARQLKTARFRRRAFGARRRRVYSGRGLVKKKRAGRGSPVKDAVSERVRSIFFAGSDSKKRWDRFNITALYLERVPPATAHVSSSCARGSCEYNFFILKRLFCCLIPQWKTKCLSLHRSHPHISTEYFYASSKAMQDSWFVTGEFLDGTQCWDTLHFAFNQR
ncbi:hypothetical protein CEXT_469351 [Caerostris extrusa]|uniref:Uncharacterized protein n=1 Tax=Caerostris extrusa TaxID=172846 RepID=A0AAV4WQL1_CAEEX|nr:hypothetical protein CEXT_469351 [Caerostris extrusa]